jgi:hypothetical protein
MSPSVFSEDDGRIKGRTNPSAASPPTSSAGTPPPRSILDFKGTPGRTIYAEYNTATALAIPNTDVTIVQYDTVVVDTHSCVTTGAAWKYTAAQSGVLHGSVSAILDDTTTWAATEVAELFLYKNGVVNKGLSHRSDIVSGGASIYVLLTGSFSIYLATGDYIDIRMKQTSGGALALLNQALWNWISLSMG